MGKLIKKKKKTTNGPFSIAISVITRGYITISHLVRTLPGKALTPTPSSAVMSWELHPKFWIKRSTCFFKIWVARTNLPQSLEIPCFQKSHLPGTHVFHLAGFCHLWNTSQASAMAESTTPGGCCSPWCSAGPQNLRVQWRSQQPRARQISVVFRLRSSGRLRWSDACKRYAAMAECDHRSATQSR